MINNFFSIIRFLFVACIIYSCGNNNNKQKNENINALQVESYKKPLEGVNKKMIKNEKEEIDNFISRYGWKMQETGTGLKYMLIKKGNGVKAEIGKIARINFEIRLITGDLCYSSKNEGVKEFLIGKSNEVSGLEEGILLLRVGDIAKFILPSHLAFGLLGDEKKIPKRATLIYHVELLTIK